jgi:hypothetical protein
MASAVSGGRSTIREAYSISGGVTSWKRRKLKLKAKLKAAFHTSVSSAQFQALSTWL